MAASTAAAAAGGVEDGGEGGGVVEPLYENLHQGPAGAVEETRGLGEALPSAAVLAAAAAAASMNFASEQPAGALVSDSSSSSSSGSSDSSASGSSSDDSSASMDSGASSDEAERGAAPGDAAAAAKAIEKGDDGEPVVVPVVMLPPPPAPKKSAATGEPVASAVPPLARPTQRLPMTIFAHSSGGSGGGDSAASSATTSKKAPTETASASPSPRSRRRRRPQHSRGSEGGGSSSSASTGTPQQQRRRSHRRSSSSAVSTSGSVDPSASPVLPGDDEDEQKRQQRRRRRRRHHHHRQREEGAQGAAAAAGGEGGAERRRHRRRRRPSSAGGGDSGTAGEDARRRRRRHHRRRRRRHRRQADLGTLKGAAAMADTSFQRALKLTDTDPAQAAQLYRVAAQLGHASACFNLALLLERGIDGVVAVNDEEAGAFLEKAAKAGLPPAAFNYALRLEAQLLDRTPTKEEGDAIIKYMEVAAKGSKRAQCRLGKWLLKGEMGQEVDVGQGLQWLYLASACGSKEADYVLAVHNLEQDDKDSARPLLVRAASEFPDAMVRLAKLYQEDAGDRGFPVRTKELLQRAAMSGNAEAMYELGKALLKQPESHADAVTWLIAAARAGFEKAHPRLAHASAYVVHDASQQGQIVKSTLLVAENGTGDAEAMARSAFYLIHPPRARGKRPEGLLEPNLPRARNLLEAAARTNNVLPKIMLALALRDGVGGPRDHTRSAQLIRETAGLGQGIAEVLDGMVDRHVTPGTTPLAQQPWFWPSMSSDHATKRLTGEKEGSFLFRPSTSRANTIAVSFVGPGGHVKHSACSFDRSGTIECEEGEHRHASLDWLALCCFPSLLHPVCRKKEETKATEKSSSQFLYGDVRLAAAAVAATTTAAAAPTKQTATPPTRSIAPGGGPASPAAFRRTPGAAAGGSEGSPGLPGRRKEEMLDDDSLFHRGISSADARRLLTGSEPGTFLFRPSSERGHIALTFTTVEGAISSTLLRVVPDGYHSVSEGKTHASLWLVVKDNSAFKHALPAQHAAPAMTSPSVPAAPAGGGQTALGPEYANIGPAQAPLGDDYANVPSWQQPSTAVPPPAPVPIPTAAPGNQVYADTSLIAPPEPTAPRGQGQPLRGSVYANTPVDRSTSPPPAPKRRVCRALYDYDATQDDELSFRYGDMVELRGEEFGGWIEAAIGDRQGMAPANYFEEAAADEGNVQYGNIGELLGGQ